MEKIVMELYRRSVGHEKRLLSMFVLLPEHRIPVETLQEIEGVRLKSHTKVISNVRKKLNELGLDIVCYEQKVGGKRKYTGLTRYRICVKGLEQNLPPPIITAECKRSRSWRQIFKDFFNFNFTTGLRLSN